MRFEGVYEPSQMDRELELYLTPASSGARDRSEDDQSRQYFSLGGIFGSGMSKEMKQKLRSFILGIDDAEQRATFVKTLKAEVERFSSKNASVSIPDNLITLAVERLKFAVNNEEIEQSDKNVTADSVVKAFDALARVSAFVLAGGVMEGIFICLPLSVGAVGLALDFSIFCCELLVDIIKVKRSITAIKTAYKLLKEAKETYDLWEKIETAEKLIDVRNKVKLARENLKQVEGDALNEMYGEKEAVEPEEDDTEIDFPDAGSVANELDEEIGDVEESDELEAEELNALEDASVEEGFVRELDDLAGRSFESESELDDELDNGLDAMAQEYFVKRLRRRHRRGKGKGVFGKILKAGGKIAGKLVKSSPVGKIIEAGTQVMRGNLKGALGSMAKAALGTVLPPGVGTVATTAIDALGGEEGELRQRRRRAIRRVARISRDAYREAADSMPEAFDDPFTAHEVAHRAVERAMIRNRVRPPQRRFARQHSLSRHPGRRGGRRMVRPKPKIERKAMPAKNIYEPSDIERELELYLGREFESIKYIDVKDLEKADIILTTSSEKLSGAIRWKTGSNISHAVLHVGNGLVVEAIYDFRSLPEFIKEVGRDLWKYVSVNHGVTLHSIEAAFPGYSLAEVYRYPGLTNKEKRKICDFATDAAKKKVKFDLGGMIVAGLLRPAQGSDDALFCSELVLKAYENADKPLFENVTQGTPGDLKSLSGTKLTYIGNLDLTKVQSKEVESIDRNELERNEDDFEDASDDEFEDVFDDEVHDEFDDEVHDEFDDEVQDEFDESEELAAQELNALEDRSVEERFARELNDLADRSFESESDLNEELNDGLDAIATEYFVKRLRRKHRHRKHKGLFKKILNVGAKVAGKLVKGSPIGQLVEAGTDLIKGNVKGALGGLAKAAVGAVLPPGVGSVATATMDALGGEENEIGRRRRQAVRRVARIARDAYREIADDLPYNFDHPLTAHEVAQRAVQHAMARNGVRPPRRDAPSSVTHTNGRRKPRHPGRRVIRLKPDEEVLLVGGD